MKLTADPDNPPPHIRAARASADLAFISWTRSASVAELLVAFNQRGLLEWKQIAIMRALRRAAEEP